MKIRMLTRRAAVNLENSYNSNVNIRISIIAILLLIALIPAILAIFFAPIPPDSGYYLSIIEGISKGYDPYSDLNFGYTPLVVYLGAIIKRLFSVGLYYEPYLILHFSIQFATAFLVYKICHILIGDKNRSGFAAILFILMSHWNEGNGFLLETPSLFFGLFSIYLMILNPTKMQSFFLIGFLSSLSFLSKQYGLGFLFLAIINLMINKRGVNSFIFVLLGFSIPVLICLIIWGQKFVPVLYGGGYGTNNELLNRLTGYLINLKELLFNILPPLLVAMSYSIFKLKNKKDRNLNIFLLFGIFGFMLQFLIAPFPHYYLYVIPFGIIYVFYIYSKSSQFKIIFGILIALTFCNSFNNTYRKIVYREYIKKNELKHDQYLLADKILENISENDNLYITEGTLMPQFFLTGILPPNLKTIGYSFGIALSPKTHLEQIKSADYILKYKESYDYFNLSSKESENLLNLKKRKELSPDVELLY